MASLNRQVANEILSRIQAATFSVDVEATRRDVPRHRAEELTEIVKVDLFEIGVERERQNRNRWQYTVVMHLAVQFMPGSGTQDEIDDMDSLREEIEDTIEVSPEFNVTKNGRDYHAVLETVNTLTLIWAEKLRETGAFVSLSEIRWRLL